MEIEVRESDGCFSILTGDGEILSDLKPAALLREIEGIIVPTAQVLRADLVFVHAGAVGRDDRLLLMVGESGAGKSTLTWALTERGFRYGSDELAPLQIETDRVLVFPYPHAICMKRDRPDLGEWPEGTFAVGANRHIPVAALSCGVYREARPVTDVLFVSHRPRSAPEIAPLSRSEIGFRIYPQLLNALAHPKKGLAAARSIAERVNGYRLRGGDLEQTCDCVLDALGI